MDAPGGSYMQYGTSANDDFHQFFQEADQYAALDNNSTSQFDPALFTENGLASFSQPSNSTPQPPQSHLTQAQRQTSSQSPALPQFKQNANAYNSSQYGQNVYNQPIGQAFDPSLLSRPTPSPGPFDQYAYRPQQAGYGQTSFDYSFNSFHLQRQASTPTQAFRPQASQQAQQFNINTAQSSTQSQSQSQSRTAQVQNNNSMPYGYSQTHQMPQRYIEPSMLKPDGQLHQNALQAQPRPMENSPYFQVGRPTGATLDPRALQMGQQYLQMQQNQGIKPGQFQQLNNMPAGQPYNMYQAPQHYAIQGNQTANVVSKPQTKKAAKLSGSATSSEDDLDIEEEEPEPKPAAITIAKPADYRGKLLWETVDAVWTPHNKPALPEKVKSGLKFIGNAVRGLRDDWKAANDQLKQAELPNSATKSQAEGLKEKVASFREIMENLAARITRFGHPSIVTRLGENQLLLSALYSFLLDRVNAEDYNGSLVAVILQLGAKLETVDEEQLEKVKWTKILTRFTKKSTNESKTLAQQIQNNAKKATQRKKQETSNQVPSSPSGTTSQIAGVKRPREGSDSTQQVKKTAVKPSSKPLSVQLAEQRKLKEKEKLVAAKDSRSEKLSAIAGGPVPARPKVTTTLPAKAKPFALVSASKKPGTTNAERATKDKVDVPKVPAPPKKDAPKPDVPATKPPTTAATASSFLGLLADMNKPKDTLKAKIEEDPNETPEERAKRQRKERRRLLRVTWKPEGDLVQTRIFEHDPEEETGHEDSMMRDAGDTTKEGEMLKQGLQGVKEDDSDESDSDDEIEYFSPSEVDFSEFADMKENYIKFGGDVESESSARAAQERHESGNMMTVYAAGEQPNTPSDPADADEDDDFSPVVDFGNPDDTKPHVRQREQAVYARRQQFQQPAPQTTPGFDLSSALASLYPQQTNQTQQHDWLQMLGTATQPQPTPIQPPQQQSQGIPNLDVSALMAAVAQAQQQQQTAYQVPAATAQTVPGTGLLNGNIASLLSQLQQPNAPYENPNPYPGRVEKKDKKDNSKKKGKSGAPIGPDGLPLNYKTKVCEFWLKGACTKGDSCTYRHDHDGME